MRAGRLKTRRYKRRGRGPALILILIGILGAAWHFGKPSLPALFTPAPSPLPAEEKTEQRPLTLPGKIWYALQLGVFEEEAPAKALAASFRSRGAGGLIEKREHYRVLAAAYEARADAQQVQSQLRSQHGIDTWINEIARPEITLHLTGQRAQLTALADAYSSLDQAAARLSALALGLDQRKLTLQQAREALQSEKETADALLSRLTLLFEKEMHPAVDRLITLLSSLSKALQSALSASKEAALGGWIKYSQLLCITGMDAYARQLVP